MGRSSSMSASSSSSRFLICGISSSRSGCFRWLKLTIFGSPRTKAATGAGGGGTFNGLDVLVSLFLTTFTGCPLSRGTLVASSCAGMRTGNGCSVATELRRDFRPRHSWINPRVVSRMSGFFSRQSSSSLTGYLVNRVKNNCPAYSVNWQHSKSRWINVRLEEIRWIWFLFSCLFNTSMQQSCSAWQWCCCPRDCNPVPIGEDASWMKSRKTVQSNQHVWSIGWHLKSVLPNLQRKDNGFDLFSLPSDTQPARFSSATISEPRWTIDLFVNLLSPTSKRVSFGQCSYNTPYIWANIPSLILFPWTLVTKKEKEISRRSLLETEPLPVTVNVKDSNSFVAFVETV